MRTEILFEDAHIIVARKPAGLATQSSKVGQPDMVSELKGYLADKEAQNSPYLGIVHRLDQPVEGLLVFAKNSRAAAQLTGQLSRGTLNKYYLAVLCGKPRQEEDCLVDYLYKTKDNRGQVVEETYPGAKRAQLRYRVLETLTMQTELTLARIQLQTGRFHQIRVQMAHAGLPLLGDFKYGDESVAQLSRSMGVAEVGLCACFLEFVHPVTKKRQVYYSSPRGKAFCGFQTGEECIDK